jgi:hypothetical protein
MATNMFCGVCSNKMCGEVSAHGTDVHPTAPNGWRLVRVTYVEDEPVFKADSACSIYVGPKCTVKGEPQN